MFHVKKLVLHAVVLKEPLKAIETDRGEGEFGSTGL